VVALLARSRLVGVLYGASGVAALMRMVKQEGAEGLRR